MTSSRKSVWFCLGVAALGLALLPFTAAFTLQWLALWLGLAAFFEVGRLRLPGFVPPPAAASLAGLGLADDKLEGPLLTPWYLILAVGTAWLCVAPVGLIQPRSFSLIAFGIPIALVLALTAWGSARRQRESARITDQLVNAAPADAVRVEGRVQGPEHGLVRVRHWFSISGTRQDTTWVEAADGSSVPVTTTTPTSTTYGYRQELRNELEVQHAGELLRVDTGKARWAAPAQLLHALPRTPGLDPLPTLGAGYIRAAQLWEREQIGAGDRVVLLGVADGARIGPGHRRPVVIFGCAEGDPTSRLRALLRRRRALIGAQLALALVALVGGVLSGPSETPELRPSSPSAPTTRSAQ